MITTEARIVHVLSINHRSFVDVWERNKTCVTRKNDRKYSVGDILQLEEHNEFNEPTGRVCYVTVERVEAWLVDDSYVEMFLSFGAKV